MRRLALAALTALTAALAFTVALAVDVPAVQAGDPSCPAPHPPALSTWTAPADATPPPIDLRVPAHTRTATFALG